MGDVCGGGVEWGSSCQRGNSTRSRQNQRAAGWKKSNKRAILRALLADQPQLVTYTRTSVDDRVDSSGGMWKSGSEQLLQCFHTT